MLLNMGLLKCSINLEIQILKYRDNNKGIFNNYLAINQYETYY